MLQYKYILVGKITMIKLIKIHTYGVFTQLDYIKKLCLKRSVLMLGLTMDFLQRFSV